MRIPAVLKDIKCVFYYLGSGTLFLFNVVIVLFGIPVLFDSHCIASTLALTNVFSCYMSLVGISMTFVIYLPPSSRVHNEKIKRLWTEFRSSLMRSMLI